MTCKVYVDGGLGNQLFQVALAIYLNKIKNKDVILDVSLLEGKKQHGGIDFRFLIDIEDSIKIETGDSLDTILVSKGWGAKMFRTFLRALRVKKISNFLLYDFDAESKFSSIDFNSASNNYLGYFQFPDAALLVKDIMCSKIAELRNKELSSVSCSKYKDKVAIHIRRGDFLESKCRKHGTVDIDYINKAMSLFGKEQEFMVFSDDISWCKSNINARNVSFSDEKSAYCDFLAMTLCSSYILTASTFGFWAAFFSINSENKMNVVISKDLSANFLSKENTNKLTWKCEYV
ncbi:alpha-1,2-fucosyltransferase [Photobacterium sp. GB-72]|uniref:alpha-1,2-fucosyltransferase n=1 Tax=Photobacterium sp. GB-72 TaxID=2022105 RepID=UPI000D17A13F|nr:alpha-1,2-fucosyltransferase [Photobacterium sp. GB-72]PSV32330.1 hypothetical protein C9J40_03910 [Photobacterium sp. GB-72]